MFKQIIDQLGGKIRFIIYGGAPLDKEVAKGFNELGISIVQGYGLTETSPVIAAENCKNDILRGLWRVYKKDVESEILSE